MQLILSELLSDAPTAGTAADDAATGALNLLIDRAQAQGIPPRLALAALASRVIQVAHFDLSMADLSSRVVRQLDPC
jgi:hypothetical protein